MSTTTAQTALPQPPPATPLTFLELHADAVVCSEAVLEGPFRIIIGAGSVIHPKAIISAKYGPILIGANNVVEEHACIRAPVDCDANVGIVIEDMNLIRVGAVIEANIGNGNVIECRAIVPSGMTIASGCVIGSGLSVDAPVIDGTILYGSSNSMNLSHRRRADQFQTNVEDMRPKIEILRDLLSKTHRILH